MLNIRGDVNSRTPTLRTILVGAILAVGFVGATVPIAIAQAKTMRDEVDSWDGSDGALSAEIMDDLTRRAGNDLASIGRYLKQNDFNEFPCAGPNQCFVSNVSHGTERTTRILVILVSESGKPGISVIVHSHNN